MLGVNLKKLQYKDAEGNLTISRIGSYLAWTEQGEVGEVPRNEQGTCTLCNGFGYMRSNKYGVIRCLCSIEKETFRLMKLQSKYASITPPKEMDDFVQWGSSESRARLNGMYREVLRWVKWPDYWLTIMGITGSGKSHMLSAIAAYFGPWALYITATDFEAWLGRILDNPEGEDGTITQFIDVVRYAPILLYDDLGSEYVKTGKDWVRSNLRKVIDYRYLRHSEYPTVIASNLNDDEIIAYDMRIGSRILDIDKAHIIRLDGVGDYRRRTT